MKFYFLLCMTICFLNAKYSDQIIADELRFASLRSNIDKRVLYIIAKIESGFNPLIISFTSFKDHNYPFLKKNIKVYKNKYLISFIGDEVNLKFALRDLISKGYRVDAGLMQINSINFSTDEIDNIFDIKYNIDKSLIVLKKCINSVQNTKKAIECYNKGNKRSIVNFDYYKKFKNNYISAFVNYRKN